MSFRALQHHPKYIRQLSECKPPRTHSISLSNVTGALHMPKGITRNCNKLSCIVNAVFCLSCSSISICQYPLAKCRVENHWHIAPLSVTYPKCPLFEEVGMSPSQLPRLASDNLYRNARSHLSHSPKQWEKTKGCTKALLPI